MGIVSVKNLVKDYILGKTKVHALRGINLEIEQGEFLTVAGSSGSGKSTLLNIIGCLDTPISGEVWIKNRKVIDLSEKELNRVRIETIGFIFQSFNLIPVLNIYENIELPLLIRKDISKNERRDTILHFIEEVGLTQQIKQKPSELSGGQRQRVAVARALSTKPQIVLADEPTANLDSVTGLEIIELMHDINKKEKTTFIFSTHDPKIIKKADRVVYLEDGQIIRED